MSTPQTPGMDPWVIQPRERLRYQEQFDSLKPINGIVTGEQAKGFLLRSQLQPAILGQIWALSDTDADGKMDINEFSIACKLINLKLRGFEIPKVLPPVLVQSLSLSSGDASLTGLSNGSTAPNNVSSLVNLSGHQPMVSQTVASAIPTAGNTLIALQQNRQIVAPSTHATTHISSKPPARPAPPSVGIAPPLNTTTTSPPQRPAPPTNIGNNFTATTGGGPPPKPAPPSFPNSPTGISPIKVTTSVVGPTVVSASPSIPAPGIGIPSVAPIAPLNTTPVPMAAFNMAQSMPAQPLGMVNAGMVASMTGIPSMVPSIGSINTGTGVSPSVALPLVSTTANGTLVNGAITQTPVSTSTPLSTTARPPSIDRVGSVDSQHSQHSVGSPQSVEWAVPHQTKLKYTQLFNTWDRTRSGFLSGPQARNIMVQSQLPQPILAQIWALADMDSDGRLGSEEFVLAMHLCDIAKAGENIPTTLPLELIPPTFRRQRQSSLTLSQNATENIDPLAGMPQTSFEDKRKENFEKGQAELERRRKALLEIQRKEQEERERKEREEAEKQEKIRQVEQERRRQAEIEKQMQRQKEIEQEKEEQRKRAQEQKEAARKEMERQRQLEWERQKSQELQAQRQKEQDILLKLKARNQTLTIELGTLNDKVKELSQKICDTRVGVSGVKTTIDGMRSTRDTQLQEMAALKNKLREQNQRLLALSQEKARIEARNKINAAQDAAGQEAIKMAFDNKQITLKQMKDKIVDLQQQVCLTYQFHKHYKILHTHTHTHTHTHILKNINILSSFIHIFQQIDSKMSDIENNNTQLEDIKTQMMNLAVDCKQLYVTFDEKKKKVIDLRSGSNVSAADFATSAWGDSGWGDAPTSDTAWPVNETTASAENEAAVVGVRKYRALYEFVARNQDEISFQPGDIILVPPVQNAEPGWMAGEIRGHTGWFPESYVEPVDTGAADLDNEHTFIQQDSVEKRTLEGIAEVPENVSDAGSLGGEAPVVEAIIPTLGLGTSCAIQVTTLFPYRPTMEQHLFFEKGEIIDVSEQQDDWWYGSVNTGNKGWFPKSYVKEVITSTKDTAADGLNEYYVALYRYDSTETGDLSFNQGEVVLVTKKEGEWWTGCIGNKSGIFPSNYVEKYNGPNQDASLSTNVQSTTIAATEETKNEADTMATVRAQVFNFIHEENLFSQRGRKPEIVQVIAPYQATSSEQLDLQRGQLIMIRKKTDSGWWEGELQARGKKRQVGWFPATYVKPLTSSSNRRETFFVYILCVANELMIDTVMYHNPMERKRQEHIKELIVTEQAYIEDMRLVHEVFEKPLIESLVLSIDEIERIFINWRDIIACNDNFLRTLRIRRDNSYNGIVRMIGDILCENIPRMSAYIRFCSCQISAAMYLQRLTETSPEFVRVAQACQQDPRTKGMPLSSFLIKPMQRITKYPLIINKILEYTPIGHPDRQYLQEALAKSEEFCTQVNEGVREKENSDRLEWLQSHIICDGLEEQLIFNSLTNSLGPRKLLHFGILHKSKSGKELVSFLTNDFLLFVQPIKFSLNCHQFSFERNEHQKFKMYRKPIFLNELSLFGESDGNSSLSGSDAADNSSKTLRLKDQKKSIILLAPSVNECSLWSKRIVEARRRFLENEKNCLQRQRSKQAQFGACGRILVTVLEGFNLKAPSVRRKLPQGRLVLVVMEAEDLAIGIKGTTGHMHIQVFFSFLGKCNAFCKVSMGSQEERTGVVSGSDCPLWDASMQFQVKDLFEDTLCITVFDKGYYSPDEFLGRAEIRVADITRDRKNSCGPIQKRIKLHEVESGEVVLKIDLRLFG
ncbi:Intersectin-2 [Trachymyrmex zeteki]|uniref:Intersectin-2 n=1 Tax=Mycetomoellerius zeteki TaxID=64791 RepID=A0A151WXV6_9HYME|nr:Intersectin-2 [Trachymyrmex zeteki]